MEVRNGIKSHTNRSLGRPRSHLLRCCEVLFNVFVYEFVGRQKGGEKTQRSATLADKVKTHSIFGRGRRERWGAGEEKEEGLLRTVDCVFKSR